MQLCVPSKLHVYSYFFRLSSQLYYYYWYFLQSFLKLWDEFIQRPNALNKILKVNTNLKTKYYLTILTILILTWEIQEYINLIWYFCLKLEQNDKINIKLNRIYNEQWSFVTSWEGFTIFFFLFKIYKNVSIKSGENLKSIIWKKIT